MKTIKLNKETNIPILGFGTWTLQREVCQRSVEKALEVGYRHIDTADKYGNHREIAWAIKNSGLKRKDLFLTTKVWRGELTKNHVIYAGEEFLDELDTEYIDLFLIHWPNHSVPIEETLAGMEELKSKGIIKAYGVSNFSIKNLKAALDTGYEVVNNQVEFHPSFSQKDLKQFCDDRGVKMTAYAPNGSGQDLKLKVIKELARKYSKTEAQVILNWILQKGIIAIPRSANPDHIEGNLGALGWKLEKEDIQLIDNIKRDNRLFNPAFSEF